MTTLLGEVLALSPGFHLVIEPLNQRHPIGDRTLVLPHMYEYLDQDRYTGFRHQLERLIAGHGFARDAARKLGRVRSAREVKLLVRLVEHGLRLRHMPRPAIVKDPFLAFTARTMQQVDRVRVVIGVRHPGGWVESIVRTDGGFDFGQWLEQPAVLEALPDLAGRIAHFARQPQPPVVQAAFAWLCFQTFHARYMLGNELTLVVRQEDFVAGPREWAERLFGFAAVAIPPDLDRFLAKAFGASAIDHEGGDAQYTQRDGRAVLDKWRQRLTPEEQALIRRETEELASVFGYREQDWW